MENKNMIFVKMMNMSEKQNQQEKASLKTRWKQVRQELSRSVFNADKWINLWAELTPVEFNSEAKTLTVTSNFVSTFFSKVESTDFGKVKSTFCYY